MLGTLVNHSTCPLHDKKMVRHHAVARGCSNKSCTWICCPVAECSMTVDIDHPAPPKPRRQVEY